MDTPAKKKELEHEFFKSIPKARTIDPFFRGVFEFMYAARERAGKGGKLLDIFMSSDMSGKRDDIYRKHFFDQAEVTGIDFDQDTFVYNGTLSSPRHQLPFPDNTFDVVVTTKYIMEHVSEPSDVLAEIRRVLKPGGEAFLVAAHVRRQHQKPHDYFRFTEYALEYLTKKVGFSSSTITTTDGAFYTLAMYSYFFERSISMPKVLERFFDGWFYYVTQPYYFFLQRHDNGYGRDLASYFFLRAKK